MVRESAAQALLLLDAKKVEVVDEIDIVEEAHRGSRGMGRQVEVD